MSKLSAKIQQLVARAGVRLIKHSGIADGYWRRWRGAFFEYAQSQGVHVLPVHYYSPIPDTRTLSETETPPFTGQVDYAGEQGMQRLRAYAAQFGAKYDEILARSDPERRSFSFEGSPYHPVEAEVLYAKIRLGKPKRVIEIGCGYSTLLISEAIRDAQTDDAGYACDYTCYEPYRPSYLDPAPAQVTRFVDQPVQGLTRELVGELRAGDVLFIDSTHVVAMQSDVVHEFLTLLPSLAPGVCVHVHDIFLPYDYPMRWMNGSRFFWNEQYLLYAYLLGNRGVRVELALHDMWRSHERELRELYPSTSIASMSPSAMWLLTCDAGTGA